MVGSTATVVPGAVVGGVVGGVVSGGWVVLFDVPDNETLHRLMNEWAEIIPATFEVYPLIDTGAAQAFR